MVNPIISPYGSDVIVARAPCEYALLSITVKSVHVYEGSTPMFGLFIDWSNSLVPVFNLPCTCEVHVPSQSPILVDT